jgi:glutamate-1-semialdehyde aminotransferase
MLPLSRTKLEELLKFEEQLFNNNHPKSINLYQRASKSLYGGVPMSWMVRWGGSFPVLVKEAKGAHFTDVDRNSYIDFCLGDTDAMAGHAPAATVKAIALQELFTNGVERVVQEYNLPWIVKRLGNRSEYWFRPKPPKNGGKAHAVVDPQLDRYMHLFALNRGIRMTPFHNMALISPETSEADVNYHTKVFKEAVKSMIE